jgi:CspA family cold shock protein
MLFNLTNSIFYLGFEKRMFFIRICLWEVLVLKEEIEGSRSMAHGTVKWFNNAKGFGFIRPEDGGEDIFAHYSTIQMDGYRTLKAGQDVNYELDAGPKGHHAASITPTGDDVSE